MMAEAKMMLTDDHVQRLTPVLVGVRGGEERFIVPEMKDLRGSSLALCSDEERFVMDLMQGGTLGLRKHNLWIFRTDQKVLAGDFVVLDVSTPPARRGGLRVPCWEMFVIDVKMGSALSLGGRGAGNQLMYADEACQVVFESVAKRKRMMPTRTEDRVRWEGWAQPKRIWKLVGDRREVVLFFRHLRRMRWKRERGVVGRELAQFFATIKHERCVH